MDVCVDQAWHERAVAEIDDFGARRTLDRWTGFQNPLAFNQNLSGFYDFPGLDIEQARCMEHNGMRRWL
ncbi:MAG TPA: hypothetical protein VND65_13850 [Candidatus Binatia bacterium]|nr:hypothetical protein [Candidatus Binatia bacterium]